MLKKSSGFTLIEILVTLVVISLALLGVGILQMKALQYSYASYQRSLAIIQSQDLVERLWSGMCGLPGNKNNITSEWAITNANSLPSWTGVLSYDASGALPIYTITISWKDNKIKYTSTDSSQLDQKIVQKISIPMISCT